MRGQFIPQRPYVPSGSLLRAVTYPLPAECIGTHRIADALKSVGLGRFLPRLNADLPWATTLSEGERQRLAFARVLIHRPDILVLDEATSALHARGQAELMQIIADRLPGLTLISVGHRPELLAFDERKLIMEGTRRASNCGGRTDRALHRRRSRWPSRCRTGPGAWQQW